LIRRIIIATLVLAGAVGMNAAVAAAAQPLVVGHARLAIDSGAQFPSYDWTASHEQIVILQPWETAKLYALKAANPNVKVLMYKNVSAVSSSAGPDGIYASGVSYAEAASQRWLLSDTSGSIFTFSGYSWLWAADIGLRGYQDAWAANVLRDVTSAPWDGVLMDDVNATMKYHFCVTCVAKYPSDAQYAAATQSFVENVGPQIEQAGKLAIANIGSWSSYSSVTNGWLRYLSGGMDQQFLKWGHTAGAGYADPATWATQLQEIKRAESEKKIFIGVTNSTNTDEAAAVYGYATALLAGRGDTYFYMGADWTNETTFPEYGYAIGDPVGVESAGAGGVHRRQFTGGLVLVNPTSATRSVNLGGLYSGSGRTNVSTATMGPHTGLVMVRVTNPAVLAKAARDRRAHRRTHARRHRAHVRRHRRHRRHHRRRR
jgi:hypothetical protein